MVAINWLVQNSENCRYKDTKNAKGDNYDESKFNKGRAMKKDIATGVVVFDYNSQTKDLNEDVSELNMVFRWFLNYTDYRFEYRAQPAELVNETDIPCSDRTRGRSERFFLPQLLQKMLENLREVLPSKTCRYWNQKLQI